MKNVGDKTEQAIGKNCHFHLKVPFVYNVYDFCKTRIDDVSG